MDIKTVELIHNLRHDCYDMYIIKVNFPEYTNIDNKIITHKQKAERKRKIDNLFMRNYIKTCKIEYDEKMFDKDDIEDIRDFDNYNYFIPDELAIDYILVEIKTLG